MRFFLNLGDKYNRTENAGIYEISRNNLQNEKKNKNKKVQKKLTNETNEFPQLENPKKTLTNPIP